MTNIINDYKISDIVANVVSLFLIHETASYESNLSFLQRFPTMIVSVYVYLLLALKWHQNPASQEEIYC